MRKPLPCRHARYAEREGIFFCSVRELTVAPGVCMTCRYNTRQRAAMTTPEARQAQRRARVEGERRRAIAQKRLAICKKCSNWNGSACKLHPRCTMCYLARAGAVCPDTPPKWKPVK